MAPQNYTLSELFLLISKVFLSALNSSLEGVLVTHSKIS